MIQRFRACPMTGRRREQAGSQAKGFGQSRAESFTMRNCRGVVPESRQALARPRCPTSEVMSGQCVRVARAIAHTVQDRWHPLLAVVGRGRDRLRRWRRPVGPAGVSGRYLSLGACDRPRKSGRSARLPVWITGELKPREPAPFHVSEQGRAGRRQWSVRTEPTMQPLSLKATP